MSAPGTPQARKKLFSSLSTNSDEEYDFSSSDTLPPPDTPGGSRVPWTEDEDEILREAVALHKGKNWKKVADAIPNRTRAQCAHRWQKVLNPGIVKGAWSLEEDMLLQEALRIHGTGKWSRVAALVSGRNGKQCRERWHNHLMPDVKKEPWSKHEDALILKLRGEMGNRWASIARALPGRTENAVKNRWNARLCLYRDDQVLAIVAECAMQPLPLLQPQSQHQHQLQQLQQQRRHQHLAATDMDGFLASVRRPTTPGKRANPSGEQDYSASSQKLLSLLSHLHGSGDSLLTAPSSPLSIVASAQSDAKRARRDSETSSLSSSATSAVASDSSSAAPAAFANMLARDGPATVVPMPAMHVSTLAALMSSGVGSAQGFAAKLQSLAATTAPQASFAMGTFKKSTESRPATPDAVKATSAMQSDLEWLASLAAARSSNQ